MVLYCGATYQLHLGWTDLGDMLLHISCTPDEQTLGACCVLANKVQKGFASQIQPP